MDSTMMKFSELKNEILQSHNQTEQLLKLTDELSSACEKYSKVKELFWKVEANDGVRIQRFTPNRSPRMWIFSSTTSLNSMPLLKTYPIANFKRMH